MASNIKIDASLPADTVWFITGTSSGIGKSLVLEILNSTTHSVIATASATDSLSYLPISARVLALTLDVTSESSITMALSTALSTFKHIDVLVNNAGYGGYGIKGDTEFTLEEATRKAVEINYWGPVNLTKQALQIFSKVNGEKGGMVVQVSTMGGVIGFEGQAFYHSSKCTLEGFTESLAGEIPASWNLKFLIIEPGGDETSYAGSSMVSLPANTAYIDPRFATRQMEGLLGAGPAVSEHFSKTEKVASIMVEAVQMRARGELGLRLPIGVEACTLIWGRRVTDAVQLDQVKGLSFSDGNEGILKVLGQVESISGRYIWT